MKIPVLLLLAGAAQALASTAPEEKVVYHLRESLGLPKAVPMDLGEPKPSGLPGLKVATLSIGSGEQAQQRELYLSEDGRHYFFSDKLDVEVDPDSDRSSKIRLEGVSAKGPKDAPVTVVEFSDFQCPYCRNAHLQLSESLKEFEGKVRLVFKHFPLERIHPWAQPASVAAACAGRQGDAAFWTVADGFFADQQKISKETLKAKALELAAQANLDKSKFETCFDKAETAELVRRDVADGDSLGVGSTPSFFINGHPIRGYSSFEPFRELIKEMLEGKHR